MGKTKGFLYAIQHREILMTDLGLSTHQFLHEFKIGTSKKSSKIILVSTKTLHYFTTTFLPFTTYMPAGNWLFSFIRIPPKV